jgi:tetratricopeptide (TPR) repeat protein
MTPATIDSDQFIAIVRPALERRDADHLARVVRTHWNEHQLCHLVVEGSTDAKKVACLTIGLIGFMNCAQCVSAALHDDDPVVCELAEHAMWSIWMRSGNRISLTYFKRGTELAEAGEYRQAIAHFTAAIDADPTFTEAYNQRSIAWYMLEDYRRSLDDCRQAVNLCPIHFGSLAGMGHCHAELGDLKSAARCYRDALAVNPRMRAIAGALEKLEQRIHIPA